MADGFYSNVSKDTELILYNIEEKPTGIAKKWAKATRIGNTAYLEFYFKLAENFAIPKPEIYNNDRFAIIMRRPLYQFAPINFVTQLIGRACGMLYMQGGWSEGIHDSPATVRLDKLRNFWVITLWTVQTEFKRNGKMEKVCLDYPGGDWKGAEIWGWLQYECVPQPPVPLVDRLLRREPAELALIDYMQVLKAENVDINTVSEVLGAEGQTLR